MKHWCWLYPFAFHHTKYEASHISYTSVDSQLKSVALLIAQQWSEQAKKDCEKKWQYLHQKAERAKTQHCPKTNGEMVLLLLSLTQLQYFEVNGTTSETPN